MINYAASDKNSSIGIYAGSQSRVRDETQSGIHEVQRVSQIILGMRQKRPSWNWWKSLPKVVRHPHVLPKNLTPAIIHLFTHIQSYNKKIWEKQNKQWYRILYLQLNKWSIKPSQGILMFKFNFFHLSTLLKHFMHQQSTPDHILNSILHSHAPYFYLDLSTATCLQPSSAESPSLSDIDWSSLCAAESLHSFTPSFSLNFLSLCAALCFS